MPRDQIEALHREQERAYEALLGAGLSLDITRGKPAADQLDLSNGLLSLPSDDFISAEGIDVRNYGGGTGIREIREIFAPSLRLTSDQLYAQDASSLSLMHDTIVFSLLHGPAGGTPWKDAGRIAFLCPSPGYDRHFAICEHYGIDMITIEMTDDGPDMDAVREAVKDPAVKGMWLVPTYSNPTGVTISEDVAAELAAMETAADDFRILWDNAYAVHHLTSEETVSADILGHCQNAGNPERVIIFASTSKVTHAGAGVSFIGGSAATLQWYASHTAIRAIGPDKVNQLRHAQFLRDSAGLAALMDQHRQILAPKFAVVKKILSERLADLGVATWTDPAGGYFISLDVVDGTATRVVELAKKAGVALTPAGASFPYGKDPRDRNIRIAPSFPPLDELERAIDVLATCVIYAATEKALA